jgi:GxxExxY protein
MNNFEGKELSREIIGSAMEVLNSLGHGLHEKPYENSLVVEFKARGLSVVQQPRYPVTYKNVAVEEYIPDLIVNHLIIVDTKTIDRITDHEIGQMINYLKITKLETGLIINFKDARLEWKRVALKNSSV